MSGLPSGIAEQSLPSLNIIVPMAGLGQRFADAGYKTPKPLIPVLGRPMYSWAVDSLPLGMAHRLVFVLLRTMPGFDELAADIATRYAWLHPVVLDVPKLTRGQSESVLRAKEFIDSDESLLIHNADTAFAIDDAWLPDAVSHAADGAILVFPSDESRWSYSRADDDGWVIEVREKVVISPWATTGTYWFRRGGDFVALAESAIQANDLQGNEFYVGPLYTRLIAQGGRVRNYPIRELFGMGTPDELTAFLARHNESARP